MANLTEVFAKFLRANGRLGLMAIGWLTFDIAPWVIGWTFLWLVLRALANLANLR
jgi:hypothetical protein